MALSPAEKQKRYRQRQKAEAQAEAEADPREVERALREEVERADRGELSEEERADLTARLTDLAGALLYRSRELSRMAYRMRTGSDHPADR